MTLKPRTSCKPPPVHPGVTHVANPRLQTEVFNAITDRANEFVEAAFIARWGSGTARRKGALRGLVAELLRTPGFIYGRRVAYSVPKLAITLRKHRRTIEAAIADLHLFPDFVHIDTIARGQPNWANDRSWFTHLEYRTGKALQAELDASLFPIPVAQNDADCECIFIGDASCVDGDTQPSRPSVIGTFGQCVGDVCQTVHNCTLLAGTPGVTPVIPRCDADHIPGVTPVDQTSSPPDLELQLKEPAARGRANDRLNSEVNSFEYPSPIPQAAESPTQALSRLQELPEKATKPPSLPAGGLSAGSSLDHASSPLSPPAKSSSSSPQDGRRTHLQQPGIVKARPPAVSPPCLAALSHSLQLIEDIIRQHRRIAEHKGPFVPIDDGERLLVDEALRWVTWCRTAEENLKFCARVSELAARDARQNGRTANLTYTFGGLDDKPHKFFLERVAELRERDEQAAKQNLDGELTASLLGGPRPLPPPIRRDPGRRVPNSLAPDPGARRKPATDLPPLSQEETLASIARCRAALDGSVVHSRAACTP